MRSRWVPVGLICSLVALAALVAGCGGGSGAGSEARGSSSPGPSVGAVSTSTKSEPQAGANDKTPKPKASKKAGGGKPTASTAGEPAKIVFVNVGQGDAVIIKSGSWAGLIDGGPAGSETAIESALRKLGVSRLDAVVVSHPHADHTGGLSGVVYDYRPRQAYVGEGAGSAASALRSVGAAIKKVRRGETLRFGRLRAKVLSPGSLSGDANEDSVVLLLEVDGRRFLFTGDCTGANESVVGEHLCAGTAALPAQGGPPRLALLDLVELPGRDRPEVRRHQCRPQLLRAPDAGDGLRPQGRGHAHLLDAAERQPSRSPLPPPGASPGTSPSPRSRSSARAARQGAVAEARPATLRRQQRRRRRRKGLRHRDRRVLPPRRLPLPLAQQDPHLAQGRQGPVSPLQRLRSASMRDSMQPDEVSPEAAAGMSTCDRHQYS